MSPEAPPRRNARRRGGPAGRGFTLVEMLFVVACLAILAALVLPSFQGSIRKARRTDARGALTTVAQLLERYNTERNTYVGASLGSGSTSLYRSTTENGYYALTLTTPTATTFVVTATPVGSQSADACGTYTLDQAGSRKSTGSASGCW